VFFDKKHVSFSKKHVFFDKKHVSFSKKHVSFDKNHVSFSKKHVSFDKNHVTYSAGCTRKSFKPAFYSRNIFPSVESKFEG
jgi:flagellar basal body rod protein FlgB